MQNPLNKVIDLIKKTGDNCIVLDESGNPSYVVMDFDKYQSIAVAKENVAGLTQDQLLDKINHDVSSWKETSPEIEPEPNPEALADIEEVEIGENKEVLTPIGEENSLNKAKNEEKEEHTGEKYYFEPIDQY